MNAEEKFSIVKRNTQEILTEQELKDRLNTDEKLTAYYGTACTGPFHMAYLIPLTKVFDLNKAGIKTKILIANMHAALDDLKAPWEEIEKRAEYYKKCIENSFPWDDKPEIVLGSEFQQEKDYVHDLLKMATSVTVNRATRAASEVTRMKNPKVSEIIYPLMQALDEEYLDVDMQIGGIDQRHIMALAREELPKLGYKARIELMTEEKMSASIPDSHIKIYDSEEQIKNKISKAYCLVGDSNNGVMHITKFVVFTLKDKLKIERPEKFGGDIIFENYEQLENAFVNKQLHPADLKKAVSRELIEIFSKSRKYFEKHQDMLKELGEGFVN